AGPILSGLVIEETRSVQGEGRGVAVAGGAATMLPTGEVEVLRWGITAEGPPTATGPPPPPEPLLRLPSGSQPGDVESSKSAAAEPFPVRSARKKSFQNMVADSVAAAMLERAIAMEAA
ncbi:unnamed protein product, partial [Discosporangium mesarthrocarpum]